MEFIIKKYPERDGVTKKLHRLRPADHLLITKPFGKITFQDKGIFIAAGAGITPFVAILRDLRKKGKVEGNTLIFSNKRQKDIILEKEFKEMFKKRAG